MITIVDYKMGNVGSIKNMLSRIGCESKITRSKNELKDSKAIILPGVGAFDNAMRNLRDFGLIDLLNELVINEKKPVLGICLGMQIMAKSSEEGVLDGLNWVDAEVKKFDFDAKYKHKTPHMGWNDISTKKESILFNDVNGYSKYYFVHSYHISTSNDENILATTNYGYEFVSAIQNNNIFGVQFHPEKSHKHGMKILKNFATLS
jgi:imidazole glycerol-phosphate synthase subunit HisH